MQAVHLMTDTKTKILDAASQLFLQGGIHALSVRAISKQAGLSTIGIYSHFQGKQGILDALYIEGFEMVTKAVDVLTDSCSGKDAILLAAQNYLEIVEHHEAHYRLIFGEIDSGYEPSEEAKTAGAKAFYRMTKLCSTLLPKDASLKEKQNNAMQIWAVTHGYVSLNHHAVVDIVDMGDWKSRVLQAVELMIDSIVESVNSAKGQTPTKA